jgi:hypothetical protein
MKEAGLTAKWEDRGRAKWEAIGKAEGEAEGKAIGERTAWEKVAAMLEQGYTVDELKRMVPAGIGKR